jgi:hypothetical protein
VIATETRATGAHGLTTAIVRAATIAAATTITATFETSEFTAWRWAVESGRTLVTTRLETRSGIAHRAISATTAATTATTTTAFTITRLAFSRCARGGFFGAGVVSGTV